MRASRAGAAGRARRGAPAAGAGTRVGLPARAVTGGAAARRLGLSLWSVAPIALDASRDRRDPPSPPPSSPAAAAAARLVAGAGGAPGLVEAIQARLDTMIGRPSGFLDDLPRATRARVRFLQSLQTEYDELEEAHKKEADELDRKYAALYGVCVWGGGGRARARARAATHSPPTPSPPSPAAVQARLRRQGRPGSPRRHRRSDARGRRRLRARPPGIPQFWLGALRAHDLLANQITDKDEAVLVHLMDVRCDDLEGDDAHGFRLTFDFEPNDFFEGTTLAMTYHMDPDDDGMLERVEGTAIPWKAGKDPTVKKMKRKAKPGRGGRGGAPAAPQYKIESVDSFFHWFAPPSCRTATGARVSRKWRRCRPRSRSRLKSRKRCATRSCPTRSPFSRGTRWRRARGRTRRRRRTTTTAKGRTTTAATARRTRTTRTATGPPRAARPQGARAAHGRGGRQAGRVQAAVGG